MCEGCFRESIEPSKLPRVLKMKICTSCGYMVNLSSNQRMVEWEKGVIELVHQELILDEPAELQGVNIQRDQRDDYFMHLGIQVVTTLQGLEISQEHQSELRISYGVCNRCSRQSGNYYEAIIQFRGGKRPLSDEQFDYTQHLVEKRVGESNAENAFISSIERIHKGLDFYMGDKALAKEIARELQHHFGAHFHGSFSLAGRRDGKDIYRATYLVRLFDLRAGDFVRLGATTFILEKIGEKSAVLVDLSTGQRKNLGEKELEKLRLLHGDVVEAVVVSVGEGEAQILDPISFRTVTVLTPSELSAGETIRVFRHGDGLFVIP